MAASIHLHKVILNLQLAYYTTIVKKNQAVFKNNHKKMKKSISLPIFLKYFYHRLYKYIFSKQKFCDILLDEVL